jgi:pyruvate dehydrogenase E1 component alpha subunit
VIENNLYGEYTRLNLSTPIDDLAKRADSYAMRNEIVNGQDVQAVIKSVAAAVDYARSGSGPTLLEMKTYRYSGHSRSDPATYRPEGELESWKKKDPLDIEESFLIANNILSKQETTNLRASVETRISQSIELVLASKEPSIDQIFRHVNSQNSKNH